MSFVNQRLQVVPGDLSTPDDCVALSPEVRRKARNAFLGHTDLIQSFVDENPAHLPDDELAIVRSWRHLVHGKFYVFRELTKYTVFLSTDKHPVAYGVLALTQPFEELIGLQLPILTETVLLPFKDKIVYDGLMSSLNMSFGPGIRRRLNESFKEAKLWHGIVTSLPMSDKPVPVTTPKAKPPSKEEKDETLGVIIGLIDQFCKEHLNEEYAMLCRKLAEKLARKRPSPLTRGKLEVWASAIVRVIGWVNFLDDKSQTPHMKFTDIDEAFGISQASGQAKSKVIKDLFKIRPLRPGLDPAESIE